MAQATGLRVLKAIGEAVPVRLMKRDLLFVAERLTATLDERRLSVLIRQHGIGKSKENDAPAKLLAAFLPKAEESKLGRILVEAAILLSMHNQTEAAKTLGDAAHAYKVDVDAITAKVKQEFAAKAKPSKPARSQRQRRRNTPQPSRQPAADTRGTCNHRFRICLCSAARLPAPLDAPEERRSRIVPPARRANVLSRANEVDAAVRSSIPSND